MSFNHVIRPKALADMFDAYEWYESRKAQLGLIFLDDVESAVKAIKSDPELFPVVFKNARKYLMKKFAFKVIYVFDGSMVEIIGIIHGSRSPKEMRERVNDS
ncbi:MAG: type II toxin-antitoxin system RelE/ParE family toxin [Planctomycetes bacterium]|nr:type II toxin-antitoxin system RelE/ParE family toxin [Planctomycetota bacterium]